MIPFLEKWFLGFQNCVMFSEDIWYILPNSHFMFFDRYAIRIQAFANVFMENIIVAPHLHKSIKNIRNLYTTSIFEKMLFKIIFFKTIFQKMVGTPFIF